MPSRIYRHHLEKMIDAFFVKNVVDELQAIVGGRVDKIHQPEKSELVFAIYGGGKNQRLIVSANPNYPRVLISRQEFENPDVPPMFCMLLRKYLIPSRIVEVNQVPYERSLEIVFESRDELGDNKKWRLFAELTGRHANIIFADGDGRIIDSIRKIDITMNESRQILPGLFYKPLSDDGKKELGEKIDFEGKDGEIFTILLSGYKGLSPLIAREICYRAFGRVDIRADEVSSFDKLYMEIENVTSEKIPTLLLKEDMPFDFSFCNIMQYENACKKEHFHTFCELLDRYYANRDTQAKNQSHAAELKKLVLNTLERAARKLDALRGDYQKSLDREAIRQKAELITANLYRIKKGDKVLKCDNFFGDMSEVSIRLDETLSPRENAERLYKKYNKLKSSEDYVKKQMSDTIDEIEYLESVLHELESVKSTAELSEIREELLDAGYIKLQQQKQKRQKPKFNPMEYVSPDGFKIYVGRNNNQNDILTLKFANHYDLWLHTQKIPGTHVIIDTEKREVPDSTILYAAQLAKENSKAKNSAQVPVDYTEVKFVKKPSGAKPGMVIYSKQRTVYL